jgi:hypothetical protein
MLGKPSDWIMHLRYMWASRDNMLEFVHYILILGYSILIHLFCSTWHRGCF